jgi:hypothetical protein
MENDVNLLQAKGFTGPQNCRHVEGILEPVENDRQGAGTKLHHLFDSFHARIEQQLAGQR